MNEITCVLQTLISFYSYLIKQAFHDRLTVFDCQKCSWNFLLYLSNASATLEFAGRKSSSNSSNKSTNYPMFFA